MSAPSVPNLSCNELAPAMQSSHNGLCVARQPLSSAATKNISRFCPLTSHPDILLSQEYPGDELDRTFTTYEAHQSSVGLRQHLATERNIVEETASSFQASSNSFFCVPLATMPPMGIVHERNRDDPRMFTTENFNIDHAGYVTAHGAQRLYTDNFILDNAHNRASLMNIQRSPFVPPTHMSMPVPVSAFSNPFSVERGSVQPGDGESSNSTIMDRSLYSLSESGSGAYWRCKGCMYETKRESDIVRHCLSLHHGGRRTFVCPCGKEYSRRDSLLRHSRKKGCGM